MESKASCGAQPQSRSFSSGVRRVLSAAALVSSLIVCGLVSAGCPGGIDVKTNSNELQVGYYEGTFVQDGTNTQKTFKTQILNVRLADTYGVLINGGGANGTSAGWIGQQINQDPQTCEYFLYQPTQGYQNQLQLEGAVVDNVYSGTYIATTSSGASETGTFTITKTTDPSPPSAGTYSVTATGGAFGSGTQNATITIGRSGEFMPNISIATTFQGAQLTYSGILVGTTFVGEIPQTNIAGVSEVGDWEGTFTTPTSFTGSYSYSGQLSDSGTLSGTKTS